MAVLGMHTRAQGIKGNRSSLFRKAEHAGELRRALDRLFSDVPMPIAQTGDPLRLGKLAFAVALP